MEPKSPSKSKLQITGFIHSPSLRKIVFVVSLMFIIFGIIGGYLSYKGYRLLSGKMSTYFTVVLDCGSTGSRVNVYEWMTKTASKGYDNLPILLHSYPENVKKSKGCQYHCMQTEPGLHNFVNDSSKVRGSLEPLIRYAKTWVPLGRHLVTPIFVLATAGMRRLGPLEAGLVLQDVENVVRESGFLYRKSWIRVLSGKEEAYYGWVALNYKMGLLGSSGRFPTLGLLDLGGSSLQVVAEVDVSIEDEHLVRSKIGPVEHDIAAYSLPAFGLNEAFDRTVVALSHTQALTESNGGTFEIRHPCLGSGFLQNYTCRSCFGMIFGNSRNLRSHELNSVILVGEPNWEQCKIIAREVAINASNSELLHQVYRPSCVGLPSDGGSAVLNLSRTSHSITRYHALSGFYAVSNALNLSQRVNMTMLWESGQRLCSRLWSDQTGTNSQYCFRVPYLASLIEDSLCLGSMEIIYGPPDVSWTLGASLIQGRFLWLPANKTQTHFLTGSNNEMIPSTLITFVVLMLLFLIVYFCQIKLPMPSRKAATTWTLLPSYLCPKRQPN